MRTPTSIRRRLLVALMLMTLLTLAMASGLSALMDLRLFRDHMLRDLQVLAAVVGESCVSALVFNSKESAEQRLATLAGEYQIRAATLYDARDQSFAHWQAAPALHASNAGEDLEIVHALHFDGRPVGRLVLSARLHELHRQVSTYAWLAAVVALLTLAVALATALRLQRRIARPIMELEGAVRAVSEREDYSLRVPARPTEREVDALAQAFNRMLVQIEQRESALGRANAELRRLASELAILEEAEKARLADELHDGPMQKLALAQMQIDAGADCNEVAGTDRVEAEQQLEAGIQLMREAIGELRTLQFELSPPVLHQRGLAAALDWLAADTRERRGIAVTCAVDADLPALDLRQSTILFRCARELVNNMVKHAAASHGIIELGIRGGDLALIISDDGRGFDPTTVDRAPTAPTVGGYGLYSIRERLALLGGRLEIASSADGSRLTVRLPLAQGASTDQ